MDLGASIQCCSKATSDIQAGDMDLAKCIVTANDLCPQTAGAERYMNYVSAGLPGERVAAECRLTHRWGCSLGNGDTSCKYRPGHQEHRPVSKGSK